MYILGPNFKVDSLASLDVLDTNAEKLFFHFLSLSALPSSALVGRFQWTGLPARFGLVIDQCEIINDHGIRLVMFVIGVFENACICKVVELTGDIFNLGLLLFIPMSSDNKVFFMVKPPFLR